MPIHQKRISLCTSMVIYALLFIIIALSYKKMLNVDKWIQSYLYDSLGTFGDFVFIVITYIGSVYVLFPVIGFFICVFLFQRRYRTVLLLVFNFIGVRLLNRLLKSIFERPRPELEHLVQVSSDSFPSGHSMHSIALFGFLAYLLHLKLKDKGKPSRWVKVWAAFLIGFIGLSRIYLGVHFPMDVIGGFLAGYAWLLFNVFLYTYVPKKESLN